MLRAALDDAGDDEVELKPIARECFARIDARLAPLDLRAVENLLDGCTALGRCNRDDLADLRLQANEENIHNLGDFSDLVRYALALEPLRFATAFAQ